MNKIFSYLLIKKKNKTCLYFKTKLSVSSLFSFVSSKIFSFPLPQTFTRVNASIAPFSLSLSLSHSLSPSLTLSLSPILSLSFSLSLFLPFSLSLSLPYSLSPLLSLFLSLHSLLRKRRILWCQKRPSFPLAGVNKVAASPEGKNAPSSAPFFVSVVRLFSPRKVDEVMSISCFNDISHFWKFSF